MCSFLVSAGANALVTLLRGHSVNWLLRHDERNLAAAIAILNVIGVVSANVTLSGLDVSFVNILKSLEPIFMAIASFFMGTPIHADLFVCLTTIFLGVAVASVKEVNFGMTSFVSAMIANWCLSLRTILTKGEIDERIKATSKTSNPSTSTTLLSHGLDVYFSMCWWGAVMLFPFWLFLEARSFQFHLYDSYVRNNQDWSTAQQFGITLLLAASFNFFYNQFSFAVLAMVNEYTHAISSCLKRAVVILASFVVYGNFPSVLQVIGTLISLCGVGWYAHLTKGSNITQKKKVVSFTGVLYSSLLAIFLVVFVAITLVGRSVEPTVRPIDPMTALERTTIQNLPHLANRVVSFPTSCAPQTNSSTKLKFGYLGYSSMDNHLGHRIQWETAMRLLKTIVKENRLFVEMVPLTPSTLSAVTDLDALVVGNIPLRERPWLRVDHSLFRRQKQDKAISILMLGPVWAAKQSHRTLSRTSPKPQYVRRFADFLAHCSVHGGLGTEHTASMLNEIWQERSETQLYRLGRVGDIGLASEFVLQPDHVGTHSVRINFVQEVLQLSEHDEETRKLSDHVRSGAQGGYLLIHWATPFDWNARHAVASAQVWLQTFSAVFRAHADTLLPVWFFSRVEDQNTYAVVQKLAFSHHSTWNYFIPDIIDDPEIALELYRIATASINLHSYGVVVSAAVGTPFLSVPVAIDEELSVSEDLVRALQCSDYLVSPSKLFEPGLLDGLLERLLSDHTLSRRLLSHARETYDTLLQEARHFVTENCNE
mmetsp:Transcript_8525/g.26434  ORF Transcript_8525/g.26434 Transcript_8525/m.26434 type:complete len:766 (+) Transcript_8525:865-3162(+)